MMATATSRRWQTVLLALLAVALPLGESSPGRAAVGEYTLAVVPQLPAVTMYTNWIPLVEELSRETGIPLKLKVYERMEDFEAAFETGGPDFLYASPTQTVLARTSQGYIPLVRGSRLISGMLVVRKDSPYHEARDLQGRLIGFVGKRNL